MTPSDLTVRPSDPARPETPLASTTIPEGLLVAASAATLVFNPRCCEPLPGGTPAGVRPRAGAASIPGDAQSGLQEQI